MTDPKPLAVILAGYSPVSAEKAERKRAKHRRRYGTTLIVGEHKGLLPLSDDQTLLGRVIDSVTLSDRYDTIVVPTHTREIPEEMRDTPPSIFVEQRGSLSANVKYIYDRFLADGQRMDIFTQDTPLISPVDVKDMASEYDEIMLSEQNPDGLHAAVSLVERENLLPEALFDGDTDFGYRSPASRWLRKALGAREEKDRVFVRLYQDGKAHFVRLGNSASVVKSEPMDRLMDSEVIDLGYSVRKGKNTAFGLVRDLFDLGHLRVGAGLAFGLLNVEDAYEGIDALINHKVGLDMSKVRYALHFSKAGRSFEFDCDTVEDLALLQRWYASPDSRAEDLRTNGFSFEHASYQSGSAEHSLVQAGRAIL